MFKEQRNFVQTAMDLDSDLRIVKNNHIRYSLNCLVNNTNGENLGCISNRKGNTLITFHLPSGTNKVVGACKDINRSAIVYFLYNSEKHHCILRYNTKVKFVDKILYDEPVLNFQSDRLITSIDIVGDLLYWTDGYFDRFTYDPTIEMKDVGFNPPCNLNMVKAYNYTNGVLCPDSDKYTQITRQILDVIKYPPTFNPICTYANKIGINKNNLRGNIWQFAYRYIYDGNEKSRLSPFSEIPLPNSEQTASGDYFNVDYNNCIEIILNTGHENIKTIEIFARNSNITDWYLIKRIFKFGDDGANIIPHDNDNYIFEFYNDEIKESEDQITLSVPFDLVPQIAHNQKLISQEGIMSYGEIKENYPNVDIDVKLTPKYGRITQPIGGDIPMIYPVIALNPVANYQKFKFELRPITTLIAPYDVYVGSSIDFYDFYIPLYVSHEIEISDFTNYPVDIRQDLVDKLVARGQIATIDPTNNHIFYIQTPLNQELESGYRCEIKLNTIKYPSFKFGAQHPMGIVYHDRALRSGGANISKESSVYVPFQTELGLSDSHYCHIDWEIHHKPPKWASTYQWCYAKNTTVDKFVQIVVKEFHSPESNVPSPINADKISIEFNSVIVNYAEVLPKVVLKAYSFTKGDRIRFLTKKAGIVNTPLTDYLDFEIEGIDSTSGQVIIQKFDFNAYGVGIGSIVEVYSPKFKNEDSVYYEFGEMLPIYKPHTNERAHMGSDGIIQTFTSSMASILIDHSNINVVLPSAQISNVKNCSVVMYINYPLSQYVPQNLIQTGSTIQLAGFNQYYIDSITGNQRNYVDSNGNTIQINGNHQIVNATISGSFIRIQLDLFTFDSHFITSSSTITVNYSVENITYQTGAIPAMGRFKTGDTYVFYRGIPNSVPPTFLNIPMGFFVESYGYSDFYNSESCSIGKPIVQLHENQKNDFTLIRYSFKKLEDTNVNGLCSFAPTRSVEVSNDFGSITSLQMVGGVYKVLQKSKNTSFYIGIQELTTATGEAIPVQSYGVLFSKPKPSTEQYGCVNPESVGVNDRHLYFWDQINGAFLRDSANGMEDFASVKYHCSSFFKRMKKECDEALKYNVITGFNKKYNEVVLSFITYNYGDNEKTKSKIESIVFDENNEVWKGFISYEKSGVPIDYMANIGDTFVQFHNGTVYLDDDNPLFGNLFGEQKEMIVDVICNSEQEKSKVLQAIGLITNNNNIVVGSDANWWVESIIIPATEVNVGGMKTSIPATSFRMKEDALYANIPRDENSPMAGSVKLKRLSGRVMRGNAAQIRLVNKSDKSVVLYSVILKSIPSELSK